MRRYFSYVLDTMNPLQTVFVLFLVTLLTSESNGLVLWDQSNNASTNGWYSGEYPAATDYPNYITIAADDFVLPTGSVYFIDGAEVIGFFGNATSSSFVSNWTISIYTSKSSINFTQTNEQIPDFPIYQFKMIPQSGLQGSYPFFNFSSSPLQVTAGKYWLSIYPEFNNTLALEDFWSPAYRQPATQIGSSVSVTENQVYQLNSTFTGLWVPSTNNPLSVGFYDLVFNIYGSIQDIEPPKLDSIQVIPTGNLDISGSAIRLNITLKLTDNYAGVLESSINITSPGGQIYTILFNSSNLIDGDDRNGTYLNAQLLISQQQASVGEWVLGNLFLVDKQLNNQTVSSFDFPFEGGSESFNVTWNMTTETTGTTGNQGGTTGIISTTGSQDSTTGIIGTTTGIISTTGSQDSTTGIIGTTTGIIGTSSEITSAFTSASTSASTSSSSSTSSFVTSATGTNSITSSGDVSTGANDQKASSEPALNYSGVLAGIIVIPLLILTLLVVVLIVAVFLNKKKKQTNNHVELGVNLQENDLKKENNDEENVEEEDLLDEKYADY